MNNKETKAINTLNCRLVIPDCKIDILKRAENHEFETHLYLSSLKNSTIVVFPRLFWVGLLNDSIKMLLHV